MRDSTNNLRCPVCGSEPVCINSLNGAYLVGCPNDCIKGYSSQDCLDAWVSYEEVWRNAASYFETLYKSFGMMLSNG